MLATADDNGGDSGGPSDLSGQVFQHGNVIDYKKVFRRTEPTALTTDQNNALRLISCGVTHSKMFWKAASGTISRTVLRIAR